MKPIVIFCLTYLFCESIFGQYQSTVAQYQKAACCCGQFVELFFPNLDFETPPSPPPGTFFTYGVGQTFGGWTVTRATIDLCDAGVGNLGAGNPNGGSVFVDLHGSPGLGAISYNLYGLTPGNQYRIDFWTAQNGSGFSSDGTLKIANGAWLNVSWTVSISGSVSWRKESYQFVALAANATMEFSSTGPMIFQGTLVDDIHIYECPGDTEKPVVVNPPDDIQVECDSDVPKAPNLIATDNCDPNPAISLKETTEIIDPCTKRITRNWQIKDACGNIQTEDQIIDVIDRSAPQFTKLPENKIVYCDKDIKKEFNDWIKKNGNAIAVDACGAVTWRADYDHTPKKFCDTIIVAFITTDHCGNESSEYANYIVRDTTAPKFLIKAISKNYVCVSNVRDSLRNWLSTYGFSKTSTDCDTVLLSSNFKGDSTLNPLDLTFYAKDPCGNIDSCKASFTYRSNSDTFRITTYSCLYLQNSTDTIVYIANGCDSIVINEKIKRLSDTSLIQINTCDPNHTTSDTTLMLNQFGCDSFVIQQFNYHPPIFTRLQNPSCGFTKTTFDTLFLTGQYCDSLVITENIPLQKDSNTITLKTCDPNKTDTTTFKLINSSGCDSIVTVYTIYTPQQITRIDTNVCGLSKITFDTTLYSTGLCDSLVIKRSLPLTLDTTYLQSTSCDKTKTGVFSSNYSNRSGCDSLVIQTVSLNPSDSIFISKSTCIASQAGIITIKLFNKYGCDSIVQTTTQFIPSDTIRTTRFTCTLSSAVTDTIVYMGKFCDSVEFRTTLFIPSDTNYITQTTCQLNKVRKDTLLLKGSQCDSLVYINTVFIPSDTVHILQTSCDQSKVGLDTFVLKGSSCDSVVFIKTTLLPSDTVHLIQSSCNPLDTGVQMNHLQNINGCDSLVVTNTKYNPLRLSIQLDSISCYNKNDGGLTINNTSQYKGPVELILNAKDYGDLYQLNNLRDGVYQLYIRDRRGCVTDSIQFTLLNPGELIIDLGNNLEVKKGTDVILNLQSNKTLQKIFWQPSNLTGCTNCSNIHFTADDDIWIYTQAIDNNNCAQTDSIFIHVKKPGSVFAPNVFSPNGDNINDYFFIQGAENAIVETLSIYNRWGEKVFETQNVPINMPTFGWNGTFNSEKMNPGVYVYYAKIKIENEEIELKGDLTLIR